MACISLVNIVMMKSLSKLVSVPDELILTKSWTQELIAFIYTLSYTYVFMLLGTVTLLNESPNDNVAYWIGIACATTILSINYYFNRDK